MKLHRIQLTNFKGVKDRSVQFPETGVVVISGANEIGKTSLVEALQAVLELKHGANTERTRSFKPEGSDESPSVEVELTLEPHRLVLAKTWFKGGGTTLDFLDGPRRGERVVGDRAFDEFNSLWGSRDQVLWNALQLLQATGLDQQKLNDSRALAAALDQGAQPAGDDAAAESVLARAATEAAIFYSAKTWKPTSDFKAICQVAEDARAEVVAAKRAVADLDDARAEVSSTRQRCAELEEQLAKAAAEVADWEVKEAEVAQVLERRRQADAKAATARSAHELAKQAQAHRDDLLERLAGENSRLAAAQQELEELASRENSEAENDSQLAGRVLAANQSLETINADLAALVSRRDQLINVAQLAKLSEKIAALDERRDQIAMLRAQDRADCTEAFFTELEKANARAKDARLRLESASARLKIEVLGRQPVLVDGDEITTTTEHVVTESAVVEVPDVLRLRIDAAAETDLQEEAQAAQQGLKELLNSVQLADFSQAIELKVKLTQLREDIRLQESRLSDLLAGEDEAALREELRSLEVKVAGYAGADSPADLKSCETQIAELQDRQAAVKAELLEANAIKKAEAQLANQRREEISRAKQRVEELSQAAKLVATQLENDRATATDEGVKTALEQAGADLENAINQQTAAEQEAAELGAEAIAADAELARANRDGLKTSLETADQRRIEARAALSVMNPDELQARLDNSLTACEAAEAAAESWEMRAARSQLLFQTLETHQRAVRERYVEPFRNQIATLGKALYSDPEFNVRINEYLSIEKRYLNGQWLDFEKLSTGAKEQLVILVRVAAASLVQPGDKVPVILDDALGYSDQIRLRRMWQALATAGADCQVLVLTANADRYAGLRDATRIELGATR